METYVTINLKDIYPNLYEQDCFIQVSKEIANILASYRREEQSYRRQQRRYAVEPFNEQIHSSYNLLEEELEQRLDQQRLYIAINKLPEVQAKRVYAYYFLGISKARIAMNEGVAESSVRENLALALRNLKKYLKNFFD